MADIVKLPEPGKVAVCATPAAPEGGDHIPLPDIPAAFDPKFDVDAAFNIRAWMEDAVIAKGAKVVGAGIGPDGSAIDIEIDGFKFNVFVKPL